MQCARAGARCDYGLYLGASETNASTLPLLSPQSLALKMYLNTTFSTLQLPSMETWMKVNSFSQLSWDGSIFHCDPRIRFMAECVNLVNLFCCVTQKILCIFKVWVYIYDGPCCRQKTILQFSCNLFHGSIKPIDSICRYNISSPLLFRPAFREVAQQPSSLCACRGEDNGSCPPAGWPLQETSPRLSCGSQGRG